VGERKKQAFIADMVLDIYMVKNETRTTKLAMLIIDSSSEVVTVNFKL